MPEHAVPHADAAGYVLGALEPDESRAFAEHLPGCADCQREVAELTSLRLLLDQGVPGPALPEGLAERTLAAVAQEAAKGPARPLGRGRRRPLVPAVMAAAGVAAVVAGLVVVPERSSPVEREIALVASDGTTSGTVARLHREAEGIAVELVVDGLPAPPPGTFYECWYVGEDDAVDRPARVSAGTFTVGPSGSGTVRMTTVADHERYPRIEVTREPDDGDPRSTGPVVLASPPRQGRSSPN